MTTKTKIQDAAPATEAVAIEAGFADPVATEPAATDATAVVTASEEAQPTHNVRAIPDAGFWRGDHKWHADGEDINRADFSDEQWEAITAEPLLVVTSL